MKKPSRKQLVDTLRDLTAWATSGDRTGNPYCKDAVRWACQILAEEHGRQSWQDWNTKKGDK